MSLVVHLLLARALGGELGARIAFLSAQLAKREESDDNVSGVEGRLRVTGEALHLRSTGNRLVR